MEHQLKNIPKNANRFLRWFLKEEIAEEVQGDLEEQFLDLLEDGYSLNRAKRYYWYQVLHYLRPFAIRHFQSPNINYSGMFKNYLKVSLRHFAKNKVYLLINTLGLGIALACAIAVYFLFAYNIEFDNFHDSQKMERTYKVLAKTKDRAERLNFFLAAPTPLGPELLTSSTGIEHMTRFANQGGNLQIEEEGFRESICFADSSFFKMFDFPLLTGSYQAFDDKYSIFLSKALAKKFFGDKNPIGQTLSANFANEKDIQFTVGGVLDKIPANSTFVFDVLVRYEHFLDNIDKAPNDWSDWRTPSTYLQLSSNNYVDPINQQLNRYRELRNKEVTEAEVLSYELVPFLEKYNPDEAFSWYVNAPIEPVALFIFGIMVLMILLIACFNLTNTSIALSTKRLKEIGIRKAIGANRPQIIGQFLSETLLIICFSILLGLIFAILFIVPQFRSLFSFFDFGFQDLNGLNLVLTLILILFGMSALAGTYPALYNSKFRPVALVKGLVKVKGNNWFTRSLVSLQFALSIIFLIAGTFFIKNINFQEQIDFGYGKEDIMVLSVDGEQTYEVMKNHIEQMPKVAALGGTYSHVGLNSYTGQVGVRENTYQVGLLGIGADYLPTMDFEMIEGEGFKPIASSEIEGPDVIVNQAFVDKTQLKNPIGERIQVHEFKGRIVGVVQNHLDALNDPKAAKPFVYYQTGSKTFNYLAIRAPARDLSSLQNEIIKFWKEEFPGKPYDIRRQDDVLLGPHRLNSAIFGKVFIFLTVLGILMSISGIYSMATQNIARRKKEIGIRKVLGANVSNVMVLLNKEFTWILGLAGILGALGGRFLTEALLGFMVTHHIPIGFLPVFLCAIVVFGLGIFTTSGSILKAAYANPVDSLRSE